MIINFVLMNKGLVIASATAMGISNYWFGSGKTGPCAPGNCKSASSYLPISNKPFWYNPHSYWPFLRQTTLQKLYVSHLLVVVRIVTRISIYRISFTSGSYSSSGQSISIRPIGSTLLTIFLSSRNCGVYTYIVIDRILPFLRRSESSKECFVKLSPSEFIQVIIKFILPRNNPIFSLDHFFKDTWSTRVLCF